MNSLLYTLLFIFVSNYAHHISFADDNTFLTANKNLYIFKDVKALNYTYNIGLIDSSGNIVFEPRFAELPFLRTNHGIARDEGGWKEIYFTDNKWTCKELILPLDVKKDDVRDVAYSAKGYYVIYSGPRYYRKLYDLEWNLRAEYSENVGVLSEGLAPLEKGDKYGYVDERNNVVIEPKYDRALPFLEGKARVEIDGRYAFIDKKGNYLFEPVNHFVDGFYSENLLVSSDIRSFDEKGTFYYLDEKGKRAFDKSFDKALHFREGLALVKDLKTRLWGYIDHSGEYAIPPRYPSAGEFEEGLAPVFLPNDLELRRALEEGGPEPKNWTGGYIDKTGKLIIKLDNVGMLGPFHGELAQIAMPDVEAYINKEGTIVFKGKNIFVNSSGIIPLSVEAYEQDQKEIKQAFMQSK
jgi:hypothetical protein